MNDVRADLFLPVDRTLLEGEETFVSDSHAAIVAAIRDCDAARAEAAAIAYVAEIRGLIPHEPQGLCLLRRRESSAPHRAPPVICIMWMGEPMTTTAVFTFCRASCNSPDAPCSRATP